MFAAKQFTPELRMILKANPEVAAFVRAEREAVKEQLVHATPESVPYLQAVAQWTQEFLDAIENKWRPAASADGFPPPPYAPDTPDLMALAMPG